MFQSSASPVSTNHQFFPARIAFDLPFSAFESLSFFSRQECSALPFEQIDTFAIVFERFQGRDHGALRRDGGRGVFSFADVDPDDVAVVDSDGVGFGFMAVFVHDFQTDKRACFLLRKYRRQEKSSNPQPQW